MVWSHGGVGNWYKNKAGRVIANSPWRLVDYWSFTKTLDPSEFVFEMRPDQRYPDQGRSASRLAS